MPIMRLHDEFEVGVPARALDSLCSHYFTFVPNSNPCFPFQLPVAGIGFSVVYLFEIEKIGRE